MFGSCVLYRQDRISPFLRSRVARYCFTLNNYTEEELLSVTEFAKSKDAKYLVFGKEKGESGTPHLQGFVILATSQRFNWVKNKLGTRAHIEIARGKSEQAADYCKKENDFQEFGTFPNKQGKRTDIEEAIDWGDEFFKEKGTFPNMTDLAKEYPSLAVRYGKSILRVVEVRNDKQEPIRVGDPKPWQAELAAILDEPADDRQVRFYVDINGGTGKSWFQGWYFGKHRNETQILSIGKRDDLAYAINRTNRIFFLNVPRGQMQCLQYTILEQLKDRIVFSTKYQSTTKYLRTWPHVVVFSNEEPDMSAMSVDRYNITRLHGDPPASPPPVVLHNGAWSSFAPGFTPGEGN